METQTRVKRLPQVSAPSFVPRAKFGIGLCCRLLTQCAGPGQQSILRKLHKLRSYDAAMSNINTRSCDRLEKERTDELTTRWPVQAVARGSGFRMNCKVNGQS